MWHVFRTILGEYPVIFPLSITALRYPNPLLETGGGRWRRSSPVSNNFSAQRMEGYDPVEEQRELDINGRRKKQRSCAECRQVDNI